MVLVPVDPARRDDLLALFDACLASSDAALRARGACCCNHFALAPSIDFDALDASAHRVATAARAGVGEIDGYLALDDHGAAAFLNVQPRHRVPHCFARLRVAAPALEAPAHDAAVILCVVVAPRAAAGSVGPPLVAGACAALAERGFRVADVFPARAGDALAPHEPGPVAWYEAAGFRAIGGDGTRIALRRHLG